MNPLVIGLIKEGAEFIFGKIKEGKEVTAEEVVDALQPSVVAAEEALTTNAKEAWLAELHNGGWMATNWRPIAAISSIVGLMWESVALPLINAFTHVPYPPEYVSQTWFYVLLTLIGMRGIEKINIARRR